MASQTTGNLHLVIPDATDRPKTFRSGYNANMQAIDEAISESLQECAFTVEVDGDDFKLYWHGTTATCPYTIALEGEDYVLYFNY